VSVVSVVSGRARGLLAAATIYPWYDEENIAGTGDRPRPDTRRRPPRGMSTNPSATSTRALASRSVMGIWRPTRTCIVSNLMTI